jgi:hypothetical protein
MSIYFSPQDGQGSPNKDNTGNKGNTGQQDWDKNRNQGMVQDKDKTAQEQDYSKGQGGQDYNKGQNRPGKTGGGQTGK